MIAYDLQCGNGHRFEGWFQDSQSFDRQQTAGLVTCPVCEDTVISKIPSTFAIRGSSGPAPPQPGASSEMAALGKQIVDYVRKNFDNVGADFAQEALKIHYGACEPRNIRGVSTPKEEETLRAEGVSFFKLPIPSESSDSGTS